MKTPRPTIEEVSETVRKLETLRAEMIAEGAHFRANTIGMALELIARLAPSKRDGHK